MRRKRIAVISAENEAVYQNRIIRGINAEAAVLGCEILVFTTFVRTSEVPDYRSGELNIYKLINYDDLDGIIVIYLPLEQDDILDEVILNVRAKAKCPVVCIDNGRPSDDFYAAQIFADDGGCMETMTDHVIEEHGCNDLYCITGPKNDRGACARRDGFLRSLEKHSLDTENRVFYGEFWYNNGEAVADKIISGELRCPRALICAADHIAAGAANRLAKNGIRVPEDVIVTGFDGSEVAVYNEICMTSILPPVEKQGAEALAKLWSIITGIECESVHKNEKGFIVRGQSCGCECDMNYMNTFRNRTDYVPNHNYSKRPKTDMSILDKSFMQEKLTASSCSTNCFGSICSFIYLVNDYRFYILVMCDGWDDISSDEDYPINGYTPSVRIAIHNTNQEFLEEHMELMGPKGWCIYDDYEENEFSVKKLIPDLDGRYDEPFAWYFTPLHFEDRCLGYSVLACTFDQLPFDHIYRNWTRNVVSALEMQRIRNILLHKSVRDSLTGLHNRRGMDKYFEEKAYAEKGNMIFYLVADMNRLKYINDTFGHSEGDNGILIISSAVRACTGFNEICARTGGDEFAVAGFGKYTEEDIEKHEKAIKDFIDRYNETSGKPYAVTASVGISIRPFNDMSDIDAAAKEADKLMYENKLASKQNRRD